MVIGAVSNQIIQNTNQIGQTDPYLASLLGIGIIIIGIAFFLAILLDKLRSDKS